MKNLLFVIASLLIIIWAIFLFGFSSYDFKTFSFVHILFVLAVLVAVIGLFIKRKLPGIDRKSNKK